MKGDIEDIELYLASPLEVGMIRLCVCEIDERLECDVCENEQDCVVGSPGDADDQ